MSEKVEISLDLLKRLIVSAERDNDVAWCEACGGPIWPEEEQSSVADVSGCWFAATGQERYRPDWCLERQWIGDLHRQIVDDVFASIKTSEATP